MAEGAGAGGSAVRRVVEAVAADPLTADHDANKTENAAEERRNFSVYDHIRTPSERRSLRQLPGLLRGGLRLAWRAAPGPVVVSAVVELIASVGVAVQLLVTRHLLASVISAQRGHTGFSHLVPALLVLVGISVLIGCAVFIRNEVSTILGECMSRQAARELLDVACAVDLEAYDTPAFHDRLERARVNAQIRPITAVTGLLGTTSAALSIAGIAAALFALVPLIVPAAAVSVVPLWWSTKRNSNDSYRLAVEMTPIDRERLYVQDVLSSKDPAKEVRAFALAGFFRERFEDLYERRMMGLRRVIARRLRRSLLSSLASSMMVAGTLALVFWLLVDRDLSLAAAGTAVLGLVYLGQRLNTMVAAAGTLYEATLFIDDFTLFLDLRHEIETGRPGEDMTPRLERISVENVTFTYPGARSPALSEVSLEINRGDVIALVGDNGSGKTTLAKLLSLLYQPQSGRILWDGCEIATKDPEAFRRSVAVIFQDFGRYWLSAYESIGIGDVDRVEDRGGIMAAAERAGAHEFLQRLPDGYDTVLTRLSEGGRELSVGQWQRIALARVFFRDAPFVILDEPTASLDAMAELRLFQTIRDVYGGHTVLLISHRFSTVRGADRIYVLDQGKLIEAGSHDELIRRGGKYAQMFSAQASAYADPSPPLPAAGAAGGS